MKMTIPVSLVRRLGALLLMSAVLLPPGHAARAETTPRAVIEDFSAKLVDVMKHGNTLGFKGREEKMRLAVTVAYDMAALTQRTLGVAATRLSPAEIGQLEEAYLHFSAATYADQFNSWGGERFEVDDGRPAADGMTLVPSRIVSASGKATEIDFLMKQDAGHWQIVDVLFDGAISQVAVRRSEILPVFRKDGVQALVALLDARADALAEK
jgi:phospholipid transport system substrate-binding protein